jgi:hypothetical protein
MTEMKKVFLFLGIALIALSLSAQQIYNGSFETWSSPYNPDGWGTWSTAVGQYNTTIGDSLGRLVREDTTTHANYPNDTASVLLTVDTITLPSQGQVTLAGFIAYGGAFYNAPPDTPLGLQFGYYPYTKKPDSLIFDYKYVPAAGYDDTALVVMTMNRFDSLSDSEVIYLDTSWILSPASQWTHVAYALRYLVTDTFSADSIQLIVFSSVADSPRLGTTLWLDSIHFDASVDILTDTFPAGIANIQNIKRVSAYPNPSDQQLTVLLPSGEAGSMVQLFDATGREVYKSTAEQQSSVIDTRLLATGSYTIRVTSPDRLTIYTGQVTILHRE